MQMTVWQGVLTVAAVAAGTMLTRFLPFIIFPEGKETPGYVQYLGRFLPGAIIAMLVVYCFQSVRMVDWRASVPTLIGVAVVAGLHRWKGNMLLSIAGGTVVYMVLLQFVF